MSTSRKSLHKLKIDDASDHHFFGISCPEPDYKVSLRLNRALNIKLSSDTPVKDDLNTSYGRYISSNELNETSYQLVRNRSGNSSLSKNYDSLDYLFVICANLEENELLDIRTRILEVPEITAVFSLERDKMNNIYSLLQVN